jgi:hypothetical protein
MRSNKTNVKTLVYQKLPATNADFQLLIAQHLCRTLYALALEQTMFHARPENSLTVILRPAAWHFL